MSKMNSSRPKLSHETLIFNLINRNLKEASIEKAIPKRANLAQNQAVGTKSEVKVM